MAHIPNVYKRDIAPSWYKELGAFLMVLLAVIGLRVAYYYIMGK